MATAKVINTDRFQKLPPKELWEKIVKAITDRHGAVLMLTDIKWHNVCTRQLQTVSVMPIMAYANNSARPQAISRIFLRNVVKKPGPGDTIIREVGPEYVAYIFADYYSHVNLSSSRNLRRIAGPDMVNPIPTGYTRGYDLSYTDEETGEKVDKLTIRGVYDGDEQDIYIDLTSCEVSIEYQDVCSPITSSHLFTKEPKDLALIFKGQLLGQNSGSAYQTVDSVSNTYKDKVIKDEYGKVLTRTSSCVELLTKRSAEYIRGHIEEVSSSDCIGKLNDDEVYAKFLDYPNYSKMTKKEFEKRKDKYISEYYPVITKEQVDTILENIPKAEYDVICMGLGSAGSGILDQLRRGTYASKYFLCDFDNVEKKNLRNQWYRDRDIYNSKTSASNNLLLDVKQNGISPTVQVFNGKFQGREWSNVHCKYLIAGFDSIEARVDLLNYVKEEKIFADYFVDARYDDLSASVFFIDTSKEKEMKYYENLLLQDKEAFDKIQAEKEAEEAKKPVLFAQEDFMNWLETAGVFVSFCGEVKTLLRRFHKTPDNVREAAGCTSFTCGGDECRSREWAPWYDVLKKDERFYKFMTEEPIVNAAMIRENALVQILASKGIEDINYDGLPEDDARITNTCVKKNLIDIYKFSSSFVFAAIREIEEGEGKPFVHIETQTRGVPSSMVVRK